jgi:uncharacterized membrane protein
MPTKWNKRDFLIAIMFLQLIVYVTVFFDIPIARQVLGFFYFTFLPGFIILKLLKLNEPDTLETFLLSVGLSVAFLMIAGLFINEFSLLFGVSQPLSLVPLMIVLNSLILMGGVLIYLKSEEVEIWNSEPIKMSPFALLFLCLPILSIVGTFWINTNGNNLLLLFTVIAISLLFLIGVISKKLLPSKLYPFAVLMIAIAILYHSSLISNYVVSFGSDFPLEYFLFKTTENNAHWSSIPPVFWGLGYGRTNAMLSVTILPTIYSSLLNINPTWMFKLLFPLILAFVPLGLYQVCQTYISKKYSFIAAFLFMAQFTFYTEMLGLNRQIIAELFFVLLLLVIVNKKMKAMSKMMFFMIFSFALVTSHYGLAEIFLFFIFSALIFQIVLKRSSRNVTVSMVVFFFVVMFAWYIFTSGSATFDSFVEFGNYVYRQLGDFFDPAARGQTVMTGLGMTESPSMWNTISRIFAYLTQAFIVVGFVGLVAKRVISRFEDEFRFGDEFFVFSSIAMTFLAVLILVPGLANTMNMTRFYHILLFFLAPLCVVGAEFIVKLLSKREKELAVSALLLIVLVPYFLFQTGFVYEVTGSDSWSIPLSGYRMSALRLYGHVGYTDAYSVFGAQWISNNVVAGYTQIYADIPSRLSELRIYGMVYTGYVEIVSNTTEVKPNGIVYLSPLNIIEETTVGAGLLWNSSELHFLNDLSKIYSNGGSEVYGNRP